MFKKSVFKLGLCFIAYGSIFQRFVKEILTSYYKTDAEVQKDSELQKWILDIYEHGFLSQASTGELYFGLTLLI